MKKNSPTYVILFMVAISAVFGVGIAAVHYLTADTLDANARMYRNRSIARAFNITVSGGAAHDYEQAIAGHLRKIEIAKGNRLWEVYVEKQEPRNVGFVFMGMGFWDVIRGVLVMSPDLERIVGIDFLDQKETPGLGARIEEQWFRGQFKGYDIRWNKPESQRVVFNTAPDKGELSAITGATQTTMALERILNQELSAFRELYRQENLGELQPENRQ